MGWKTAIYQEVDTGSLIMRGVLYRFVYPVAVRFESNIEVVEPIWEQCQRRARGTFCVLYFPPNIDAIVYLRVWFDFWRDVEVVCTSTSLQCDRLRQISEEIWKQRRRPISPEEFVNALLHAWSPQTSSSTF